MLIVADGEDIRSLVPEDENIRLIHIESGRNIGEKRNFGCFQSAGLVIAHFDDDDWSEAGRLMDQVSRLSESGKAVTGYSSMRFTDGKRWWEYRSPSAGFAIGTSLCYRKDWWKKNPFPAKQVSEDGDFVRSASQQNQLAVAPAKNLMAATVHPGNTSPRQLQGDQWKELLDFPGIPEMRFPE